eukprot:COSAG02_NODE_3156_length_7262_cov_12.166132_1_plen_85_part_10
MAAALAPQYLPCRPHVTNAIPPVEILAVGRVWLRLALWGTGVCSPGVRETGALLSIILIRYMYGTVVTRPPRARATRLLDAGGGP